MKIWAIANQKGGVGKTTTTVTLGGLLSALGRKTLLVDLDPHCSLSNYFGIDSEELDRSAYHLFRQMADGQSLQVATQIVDTRFDGLSVLPASMALATLDRQLGARAGMGTVVARALRGVEQEYSNVLLDCPPMLGILMVNALVASEHIIIPVQTEFLALKGLDRMLRTLEMIQRSRKTDLTRTIVPTMYDRRTRASRDTLSLLQDRYADVLWDSVVPIDTQFREASRAGVPLSIMIPGSRGVVAYHALVQILIGPSESVPEMAEAS